MRYVVASVLALVVVPVGPAFPPAGATTGTIRVSVDALGADADGDSAGPAISANGRYVAFDSYASDLVPGDINALSDIFVRDVAAGVTTRVSVDAFGGDAGGESYSPTMSANGRFVAFESSERRSRRFRA